MFLAEFLALIVLSCGSEVNQWIGGLIERALIKLAGHLFDEEYNCYSLSLSLLSRRKIIRSVVKGHVPGSPFY
ncbi:hypothetical protein WH47_11959 [Habropoda laboriosa]|uniref:Secreted protein n=1 Tax=Habropoda laboriosa TaxID=597456 RepID=A0A0L7R7P3_9HYME|nr:hypothetical protein WH47_11959 [Habropoda laboriosa]